MSQPTIFISYSHKDEIWKDRLATHLGVLKHQGLLDIIWDDRRIGAGEDWLKKIQKAMNAASAAILLVSADFLNSEFILDKEVPLLLQRREREGLSIFPVILKPCPWKLVPWLARMQLRPKDGRPISGGNKHRAESDLAAIVEEVAAIIAKIRCAVPASPQQGHQGQQVYPSSRPEKVSPAKLPSTSPDLFGREREMAILDAAWDNPLTNIISLVAWGGVGKTALINAWLRRMESDHYRGAELVYEWSFYNQGTAEGKQTSADLFIASALDWFGDPDPTKGSPWDKGERLAELIAKHRTLLILDGLEPLQNPPGEKDEGRIKDPGLKCLLRSLASHNQGLCLISTRLEVDDIKDSMGTRDSKRTSRAFSVESFGKALVDPLVKPSVKSVPLEHLSDEAGAELLKHLGVQGKGTDEELKAAVREFGGHALALTLLGRYLAIAYQGDIRQRDKIARLTKEPKYGGHARRVMESYEQWFHRESNPKPELNILRIMGLFDRPAEVGAIEALKAKPPIDGLTSELQDLSHDDWCFALHNLREAMLLAVEDPHNPGDLDCHPLVREHFGEKLKGTNPSAWKEAHSRLYEYYKSKAKEFPDTIEEMAPLYAAVAHGCQAGRYQDALYEIYWGRISRGDNKYFSTKKLGSFGADLVTMSCFFLQPWQKPVDGLTQAAKAFVLRQAGFCLRALGRLTESEQPMRDSLGAYIALEDWKEAAIAANNLSQLYQTKGNFLTKALNYAQQGIGFADRSGSTKERITNRTALADILHQTDQSKKAESAFHEAEKIQNEDKKEYPLLNSLKGFRYCNLLLSQGNYQEVQKRAHQTLEWATKRQWLLAIALDHISLGRAYLYETIYNATGNFGQAAAHMDQSVDGLRQSGYQDHLPRGLLARAELHRVCKDLAHARRDLDEAMTIAERGGMGLHQADCHLEYTRLYLALGDKEKAQKTLATAKGMIERMGYHRRDKELAALAAQLGSDCGVD